MPQEIVLAGLIIGVILYALLIRRRAGVRTVGRELASALATSSDIAVARIKESRRRSSSTETAQPIGPTVSAESTDATSERRSGRERREEHRRLGRGRRSGGDRRGGDPFGER